MMHFNFILVVYMQIAGILAEQLAHQQSSLAVDSKGAQMRSEAHMAHTDGDSGKGPVVVPINGHAAMPVKQHVKVTVPIGQEASERQKIRQNPCIGGNLSADGDVCCALSCGGCNATGCDGTQLANCCPASIVEANVQCGAAPCTLAQVTTEAPNTTTTESTTTGTVAPCTTVVQVVATPAPPPVVEQIVETFYEEVSTSEEVKDGAQTQSSMSMWGSIALVLGSFIFSVSSRY